MSEWRKLPLKEITVKIGSGSTPTGGSGAYKETGVSLIRSQNVLDFSFTNNGLAFIDEEQAHALRNVIVEPQDVLLNITGDSVARCCSAPKEWLPARVNQHVAIIRANPKHLDSLFLKYSLISIKDELLSLSEIGGTRNALTKSMLENLKLFVPSVIEQKAIASVLSSLDDKIDLLHRQNKTLESMAETLFRQWFIVEEQEDWEIYSVKDIAHHLKDTITPCKYPNVIFNHHSLPAFDSGNYPESHLGSEILSNKYKVHNKSILVSKLNPGTPRIWLINNASERDICSTEFQNLKPINPEHLEFIYCFFNARSTIENLTMSASGTSGSHQRVKPEDMMNLEFKSPNVEYISAFSEKNKPILNKVLCNRETIKTLNTLRDTLLPKLMSGEVRVEYAYEAIASIE